jgi:mRNA interferase MazF
MPSTITYSAGQLLLAYFPFTTGAQVKPRPALVILDTGDQGVLLARITSQPGTTAYDIAITDWQGAGLINPSVIRLHKLATLAKASVVRHLGALQPTDRAQVSAVLQQTFGNW